MLPILSRAAWIRRVLSRGLGLALGGDEFGGLGGEGEENVFEFPAWDHGSLGAEHVFGLGKGRVALDPVVWDTSKGGKVMNNHTQERKESLVGGSPRDWGGVVDASGRLEDAFSPFGIAESGVADLQFVVDDAAIFVAPIEAKVPFADHGCVVAVVFEERGDGESVAFDEWWCLSCSAVAGRQARIRAIKSGVFVTAKIAKTPYPEAFIRVIVTNRFGAKLKKPSEPLSFFRPFRFFRG
jgi:hypothetical protein